MKIRNPIEVKQRIGDECYGLDVGVVPGPGGPIFGGGTLNYIAKFTPDGFTIADSQLFDNGTSVGINNASPSAKAKLDVHSTTQGMFTPRVTTLQRNAIAPALSDAGLLVYNTGTSLFNYWDGAAWQEIDSNATSEWLLDGNTNGVVKYIGTNDAFDLPFYTGGVEKMRLNTSGNLGVGGLPTDRISAIGSTNTNAAYAFGAYSLAGNILLHTRNDGNTSIGRANMGIGNLEVYGSAYSTFNSVLYLAPTATSTYTFNVGNLGETANDFVISAATGYVGVGTNSPTTNLSIVSGGRINFSNANAWIGNSYNAPGIQMVVNGVASYNFGWNGGELRVVGDLTGSSGSITLANSNVAANTQNSIVLTDNESFLANYGWQVGVKAAGISDWGFRIGNVNQGTVPFYIKNDITGYVGIGTTLPDYVLTVINGARFQNVGNANALVVNPIGDVSVNTANTLGNFTVRNKLALEYANGAGSEFQFHRKTATASYCGFLYNDEGDANNLYLWNSGSYSGMWDFNNSLFGFGNGNITPAATIHALAGTINQRLEPVAGVFEDTTGGTGSTVGAVTADIQTIAVPTNTNISIQCTINYKKTAGGGVGTVNQGSTLVLNASANNIAGVVTMGTIQNSYTDAVNAIAGVSATIVVSGTNVIVRTTGIAADTIVWNVITKTSQN